MFYFLIASLPEPLFGTVPELTPARFDELCRDQMSKEEFAELASGTLNPPAHPGENEPEIYRGYYAFERYLRTRTALRRAGGVEPPDLPDPEQYFSWVDHELNAAAAAPDPLEREKLVDRIRWRALDDMAEGREFALAGVAALRLKFMILAKYRHRQAEAGMKNFDRALEEVCGGVK